MRAVTSTFVIIAVLAVLLIPLGSLEVATNGHATPLTTGDQARRTTSSSSTTSSTSSTTSSSTTSSTSTTTSSTSTTSTSSSGSIFSALYSVPTGAFPLTGAYDTANRVLYIDDLQFPGLTAINATNWAYTFVVCKGASTYAQASVYDPANNELYVACYGGSNYVAVVNPTSKAVVATVSVPSPLVLAYDSANNDIYVGSDNPQSGGFSPVSVISGATNTLVATIAGSFNGPNIPNQILYNPANNDLYVTNNNAPNYLTVISGTTNTLVTNIQLAPVGGGGAGAAVYDPSNHDIYVHAPLNAGTDSVEAISTSNVIVAKITPGCGSGTDELQLAYDSANGNLYCGYTYNTNGITQNQVCEISSSTNTYVGCVTTSTGSSQGDYSSSYLIYDPANSDIYITGGGPYVPNSPPETIQVISQSLTLLQTINIPGSSFQLTFNPANNEVYAGVPQVGSPQFNIVVPISS